MSNLVTFEQAKKLYDLGFDKWQCTCGGFPDCICDEKTSTIPEALQWIRDKINVPCAVMLEFEIDFLQFFYYGEYAKKIKEAHAIVENTGTFNTYPEAESALLDEILTYLEQKK